MKFTLEAYQELLKTIRSSGYKITNYNNFGKFTKEIIIRHDVDFILEKAFEMAELENREGISSTYFILISSPFYNIHEKKSNEILKKITSLGHQIGVHFDQTVYENNDISMIIKNALYEIDVLSMALDCKINTISFHRPSKFILDADIEFGSNIVNTYSQKFFKEITYISDSRMNWKIDPIRRIVESKDYKIQLLVHPIWYNEVEMSTKEILSTFLDYKKSQIYSFIDSNFTNLFEFLTNEKDVKSND